MQRHFTPVAWSYRSSIYEVNVRQYTPEGTFNAFAEHLPRLHDMGIQVLWFMPVTPISFEVRQGTLGSYYACSDYTAINPEFGTLEDFTSLVKKAHAMGFKVIIDWVANHTGWDHTWTRTHPEYYKRNAAGDFYDTNNWHDVIDLNYYDHNLRSAMTEAMAFWVTECDIDGFRCDMAHLVPLDFWRQARKHLDAVKPLFWLSETQDIAYQGIFDCCYTWDWMGWTEKYCKGNADLLKLKGILSHYEIAYPPGTFRMFFTSNHDENSWNGTEYEKYGDGAQALAVFSCTWNGIPLIYSGQELPNKKRLLFFDKDVIDWKEENALQDFYKTLLHLRIHHPALEAGVHAMPVMITTSEEEYVLAYLRIHKGKKIFVALNLSPHALSLSFPGFEETGTFTNIFDGAKHRLHPSFCLPLDAWGYVVLTN